MHTTTTSPGVAAPRPITLDTADERTLWCAAVAASIAADTLTVHRTSASATADLVVEAYRQRLPRASRRAA